MDDNNKTIQSFNKIFVVDSLLDTDLQTGSELYNDNIRWGTAEQIPALESNFTRVNNKNDLVDFLKNVKEEVLNRKVGPIIHIEAHGSEEGLTLRSGENVLWEDLIEHLCVINHGCGNNLLLTLAVCKGIYLTRIIKKTITDIAPFWTIIGPAEEVKAGHISRAFNQFYKELLYSFDGTKALNQLNNSIPPDASKYSLVYCETLFREVFKGYFKTLCSGKAKKNRVERLLTEARKATGGRPISIPLLRRYLKEKLKKENQVPQFEKFRRRFFMIDDYPENDERFPIKFEDCL